MPLLKVPTPKALSENIKTEVAAGKPQKEAVAIAESVKDKAAGVLPVQTHKYNTYGRKP